MNDMSVTLKVRAGAALKANVRYYTDDSKTELVDTTGYSAYLQLRAHQSPSKVLLNTKDGPHITQVDPDAGEWEIFLGKTLVRSLPPTVRFEIELVSDTNPEDVDEVESGVILVIPESVR